MIRKAKPDDIPKIAELCYIIWKELEIDMVRDIEKSRLLTIMEKSMIDVPYRGHYSNTWIYELDGQVAGCLIAYPGDKEIALEQAWLDMDLDDDIRAYGSPMPMKEAHDDEWYIETVATFPEFRGRGIATKLVQHVLESNKDNKWSLNCDIHNDGALRVYKKLGFSIDSEFDLYGHNHYHMINSEK
ncbi:GNAT family N-acetyltransferase [Staphylococcus caeli]|uniref:GNAT family N-acetyltransferase n=1 Tax=Staphylococcus caeli TaxID=2201815 RepID=UPI003F54AB9E